MPVGKQFDLVICALALCHVDNLEGAIAELARATGPGGWLLVTDFHPEAVARGWRTQFDQDGETYYLPSAGHSRQQYVDAIRAAGCTVDTIADLTLLDAPRESFPPIEDLDGFLGANGHLTLGLVLLARRMGWA